MFIFVASPQPSSLLRTEEHSRSSERQHKLIWQHTHMHTCTYVRTHARMQANTHTHTGGFVRAHTLLQGSIVRVYFGLRRYRGIVNFSTIVLQNRGRLHRSSSKSRNYKCFSTSAKLCGLFRTHKEFAAVTTAFLILSWSYCLWSTQLQWPPSSALLFIFDTTHQTQTAGSSLRKDGLSCFAIAWTWLTTSRVIKTR